MNDELLPYFEAEYAALRRAASELPTQVARALRLGPDGGSSDPFVERLLEGVAFLGARVQARLDDAFPELTDGLLGILYPQLLAPMPAALLAQLIPDKDQNRLISLPRHAQVRSETVEGVSCRFRTTAPMTLWPITLTSAQLYPAPLPEHAAGAPPGTVAMLELRLSCGGQGFCDLVATAATPPGPLRLHLLGGNVAHALYEALCGHCLGVTLAAAGDRPDPAALALPAGEALRPGGFGPDEALLPWPPQGFDGFRLLSELFALPEKFLCVDLDGIATRARRGLGNSLAVMVFLDRIPAGLGREVGPHHFALGCVPLVNLFTQRCEPIDLDWSQTEYRVDPDRNALAGMEVWSVEQVRETRADGSSRAWRRLFRHGLDDDGTGPGWLPLVRPASGGLTGSETVLALDDPAAGGGRSRLSVTALCTNRDLPAALPFGGDRTQLTPERDLLGVERIIPLTAPGPSLRPPRRGERAWRLVSQLSLNHFALSGEAAGAETLREILELYDLRRSEATRSMIGALREVSSQPTVGRLPGPGPTAFCRGVAITLTFAAAAWRSGGLFLLAAVLERFFRLHVTVNSFVRTTVRLEGHPDPVARWPARSGTREVL
ncbi:MAG: type secretion system baseplate subunit TssF [Pseudomonadota bacterium]|jgi:type VI secretion system protein ImpG